MATQNTLLNFGPFHNEPPAASYARLDTRNSHPVLDFALGEEAVFSSIMPQHYSGSSGSGVTIYSHCTLSSATSNDILLGTSFERVGEVLDIDADSFAASQSSTGIVVPGTSGCVVVVSTTHTDGAQIDGLLVGELFRLKIKRVAASGTDATGDLELLGVEVRET